jgi:hypothetical protein
VSDSLLRLSELLRAEGGLIAELLVEEAPADEGASGHARALVPESRALGVGGGADLDGAPRTVAGPRVVEAHGGRSDRAGPAQIAAAGPRAAGRGAEYELLIEAIYEGYLLHYHSPRVLRAPEQDLCLLAGDRLYALGLARLVRLGDIEAVAELADVIALSALAQGAGNVELASAVWDAGARAVGWGASAEHEQAKALARAGSPDALAALLAVAAS